MNSRHIKYCTFSIYILITILFTFSCTGSKPVNYTTKPAWKDNTQIANSYKKIVLQKFEIDRELENTYPGVTVTCESIVMNELMQVNSISRIEKARANSVRQRDTLIVKTRVTTLKLTDNNMKSEMAVHIELIDSFTGLTVGEKDLSALSSGGTSDQMLPDKLGKIIAQYIAASFVNN